jgi:threonine dehydrogenase-like Zn-dependent dehydrogenase
LKALTWHSKRDVRVDNVSDPTIREPTDAVVRMTTTAICGSDLHLYEVLTPFMEEGPRGYEIFQKKEDDAVKVLLKPWPEQTALRRGEGGSSDR